MLTVDEVATEFLRTTRRAVYQMVHRGRIPGVVRVGRRLLFRTDALIHWLENGAGGISR
jgi:excisionase family DNA binding protein